MPVKRVRLGDAWASNTVNTGIFRHHGLITFANFQFTAFYVDAKTLRVVRRNLADDELTVFDLAGEYNVYDAHNCISLGLDGNGLLHMAYDHHSTPLRYRRSISPLDVSAWTDELPMTGKYEERITYPCFLSGAGDKALLFLYRDGYSGKGALRLKEFQTSSAPSEWLDKNSAILSGECQAPWTSSPYWNRPVVGRDGTIHLSFVWRTASPKGEEDIVNNINIDYCKSRDGGDTWYSAHGRKLSCPMTQVNSETIKAISPGTNLMNQCSMALDNADRPHIVFYSNDGMGIPQYQHLWFSNNVWHHSFITKRTKTFQLSGKGTLQLPISRPEVVIDDDDCVYVIYRGDLSADRMVAQRLLPPKYEPNYEDVCVLSEEPLGHSEPVIDFRRWQQERIISILVQRNEQPFFDYKSRHQLSEPIHIIDADLADLFRKPQRRTGGSYKHFSEARFKAWLETAEARNRDLFAFLQQEKEKSGVLTAALQNAETEKAAMLAALRKEAEADKEVALSAAHREAEAALAAATDALRRDAEKAKVTALFAALQNAETEKAAMLAALRKEAEADKEVALSAAHREAEAALAAATDALRRDAEKAKVTALFAALQNAETEKAAMLAALRREAEAVAAEDKAAAAKEREKQEAKQKVLLAELQGQRRQLADSHRRTADLEQTLRKTQAEIESIYHSFSWRLTRPLRSIQGIGDAWSEANARLRRRRGERRYYEIVKRSDWFDRTWYLATYQDVRLAGIDPVLHYIRHGAAEGRDPSPRFNTTRYLQNNTDVASAGKNPLVHFLLHGKAEGREVSPSAHIVLLPSVIQLGNSSPLVISKADKAAVPHFAGDSGKGRGDEGNTPLPTLVRKHDLRVAVIAWDVGHNALGRAYLLAEAISRRFDTVLLGPQFPRFGNAIWPPLAEAKIPTIAFRGGQYPEFADELHRIARRIDCDAIIACKPRIPSLHLGLLAKLACERPLIVDVDDYEPSFCKEPWPIENKSLQHVGTRTELEDPSSDTWTRFSETLVPYADAVLVSNESLYDRFGGTIIPHARDELLFDPKLYDRNTCRAALGVSSSDKVVLYGGTVRKHKGVLELAQSLAMLGRPDYKLCIIGDITDRMLEKQIREVAGDRLILVGNRAFQELPRYLAAADLVCIRQDPTSEISRYQLPAKVIDAFAMGVPILATDVPPLRRLIEIGAVRPVPAELPALSGALAAALDESDALRCAQRGRRDLFLAEYSYQAISKKLEELVLKTLSETRAFEPASLEFERPIQSLRSVKPNIVDNSKPSDIKRYDLILFWKQFDSGVFGRRSDMLAKYFAKDERIRKVLVIEPPLPLWELNKKGAIDGVTEHRMVYREILARRLGLRDSSKLSFHTIVSSQSSRHALARWRYPRVEEYKACIEQLFQEQKVIPSNAIFWVCPINRRLPEIVRHFRPLFTVCDIIDDQSNEPGLNETAIAERIQSYKEIIGLSDLVVTNNSHIQATMGGFAKSGIRLLPNAAEVDQPDPHTECDLSRLLAIPNPRLGFVGNLESKIDTGLLEFVARERPGWNIVLIGSTHTRPDILGLARYPNIHFMGVVRYEEARTWMQHFDVALMPHLDTPLTRSMDPLKLFVYLNMRLPVVATRVAGVQRFEKEIYIADSREDFVAGVEAALSNGVRKGGDSGVPLANHLWPSRIEQALNWIIEALEERERRSLAR
jgi:glycosyltransferase involved in cell wall biosynthesis